VARILIAEDEPLIVSFIEKGLKGNGFVTLSVDDGATAAELARDADFDLLLLDVGLPKLNGFEVLDEVRGRGETLPIILLTARTEVEATVKGFELGADDYLAKPFRFEELLVRIRARVRDRSRQAQTTPAVVAANGVELDVHTRRATVDGREVDLSAKEYLLAETLIRHAGQVLTREQLLNQAWGYDFDPESNVVDVYIRYLRKKLGPDTIQTIRGAGYRFIA
jgi:DNA-binding response OmpR family regulator